MFTKKVVLLIAVIACCSYSHIQEIWDTTMTQRLMLTDPVPATIYRHLLQLGSDTIVDTSSIRLLIDGTMYLPSWIYFDETDDTPPDPVDGIVKQGSGGIFGVSVGGFNPDSGAQILWYGENSTEDGQIKIIPGRTASVNVMGGDLDLYNSDLSRSIDSLFGALDYYTSGSDTGMRISARGPDLSSASMWFDINGASMMKIKNDTVFSLVPLYVCDDGVHINTTVTNSGTIQIKSSTGGRSDTTGAQLEFAIPINTSGTTFWGQSRILTVAGNALNNNAAGKMIIGTRRFYDKVGDGNGWYYGDDIIIDGAGDVEIEQQLTVNEDIEMNSNNVDNGDPADASDEFTTLGQMGDSLGNKRPMNYCTTDDRVYSNHTNGYLVNISPLDDDEKVWVTITGNNNADVFKGMITFRGDNSGPSFYAYNILTQVQSTSYIDTIWLYHYDIDDSYKMWFSPLLYDQHFMFELCSEDSAIIFTVADAVKPTTSPSIYESWAVGLKSIYNYDDTATVGIVRATGYVEAEDSIRVGITGNSTYFRIDSLGWELWSFGELYSFANPDSMYHALKINTRDLNTDRFLTVGGYADVEDSIIAGNYIRTDSMVRRGTNWHAYGGFHDSLVVITISVQNDWYQVTNAAGTLFGGDEADGISLTGDTIVIANAGHYKGKVDLSYSGLNGQNFSWRIYNVTQAKQEGYDLSASTTGTTNYTSRGIPIYIDADAGDKFVLQVSNETSAQNVTIQSAVFYIVYDHD